LQRFVNYCLNSEVIKQDSLFETFLDRQDPSEYKKAYAKEIKLLQEVTSIDQVVSSLDETKEVKVPNDEHYAKG
jgi:hypothetical protein